MSGAFIANRPERASVSLEEDGAIVVRSKHAGVVRVRPDGAIDLETSTGQRLTVDGAGVHIHPSP